MISSGDRTSEVAEDVNVCDICGDVGEEDKLAICSRCNEGAEHIYCMKVKIEEVPEGEWLCEECQVEIEAKTKKKLEISQVKAGTTSSNNNVEAYHVENKEPNKESRCIGTPSKNKELDAEILGKLESATYNVEDGVPCIGGNEAVNRDKACHDQEQTSIERSTSFNLRSLDGERHSLVLLCDVCGDVGNKKDLAVCSRCNDGAQHTYCMQVMVEKVPDVGWLCKTCLSEVQTEKKNTELENSQVSIGASKEEPIEVKVNRPANDANTQSSPKNEVEAKYVGGGESKKRKHASLVRQNPPESGGFYIEADSRKKVLLSRGCSFKFDMEKGKHATGHAPTSLASNALKNNARALHGSLSKSISFNSSKIPKVKQLLSEIPLKPKHSKEPSVTKQVGPMSKVTMSSSSKKSNFCDPAHKAKTLMKPNAEETGMLNPPTKQNMKNNRVTLPEESEFQHLTKRNNMVESSYVSIAHGQGSKTLGHNEVYKPLSAKAPGSIETSVGILGPDAARKAVQISYPPHLDYKLINPCLTVNTEHFDNVCAMKGRSVDSPTVPINLGDKALTFSGQHFSPGYEQLASTAPELNYIWQGGFELWRTGGSPELSNGLQAHLSCSASPKVLELAKTIPSKIQLEELPRQNVWPVQFQENSPTYDNIGLFFFARDIQSYENYYSKLVENIIKSDLALRGNIETAELLIFASNTLSKNCQKWNMFIFLWGVLRVRRNVPLNHPLDVLKLPISPHNVKLLGSPAFDGGEVTLDVPTMKSPVQCSDSKIHEVSRSTATLNDAEHHISVDHVKSSDMISNAAEQFSQTSDGVHRRDVEMANWDTNETREPKKTKLDGKASGNSALQVK